MRSARVPAVGLMALMLLGSLTGATAATQRSPVDPGARILDQGSSTAPGAVPTPTAAFSATPCPVAVSLPGVVEGEGYTCGFATVPQRHADPAGTQVTVGALRIPSHSPERQDAPVVLLTGGSEPSALDLGDRIASLVAALPDRDLILMDQRGGRYSTPFLRCGEDDTARLAQATGEIAGAVALDAHLAAYEACAKRLGDAGFDLSAFDSRESALDVQDVARALGYSGDLDLVAIGPGTRVAQEALRSGMTGIRSVVLDSVVPAASSVPAASPGDSWAAIQDLSAACAEDGPCSALLPDLAASVVQTAEALTATPVQASASDGTPALIDGDTFIQALVGLLIARSGDIDAIPGIVAAAAGGDVSAIAQQAVDSARDTSVADVLAWAQRCTQDLAGAATEIAQDVPSVFHGLAGQIGDRNAVVEGCAALGIADEGGTIHDSIASDVPTLLLNGEFDPIGATTSADSVRSGLSRSYGLELPAIGHATLVANDCSRQLLALFLAEPTQEPDASCIAEMPEFGTTGATPSADPSTAPPSASPDPTQKPDKSPKPAKAPKAKAVTVGLVKVADGFENANGVTNAGDKRLFVTEQEGYVEVLKPRDDGTFRRAGKFLDIRSRVVCCGEKGFLGIAFPPDYAETGYFYITFAGTGHTWNLEERRVSDDDPDRADPEYKRRLIRVYKPLDYHWAGDMHFGADGYLYVTVGDGGFGGTTTDPGDPANRAQDLGVIFGKMLRIDPRGSRKDGERYSVPRSNPFVGKKGALPEIWAYGLRNPWRWSFDRLTNALWIGDVGMWSYEEIDRAKAPNAGKGDNFGWRRMEGPVCYNPARRCDNGKLTLPFAWYPHKNGNCAVVAGYVYRGKKYPALRSWFVFGDYCSGRVMLLDSAGKSGQKPREALDTDSQISAFGESADGELYLVDYGAGNSLYRVTGKRR
jgi:glucose/arabinose dehydrogenase/pimeloyl-ACP methyl ester carboxylesterase